MNKVSFKEAQRGTTISIPGFVPGEEIDIVVKKPQVLSMLSQGTVPNELLGTAQMMVSGASPKADSKENDKYVLQVLELYLRAVMVNPTYDEVKNELTDDQMLKIYQWANSGEKEVLPFPEKQSDCKNY